jgi:hypothetical protein
VLKLCSNNADAAYKKFAMKGNKEHPLVSILVFIIGTLVGVSSSASDGTRASSSKEEAAHLTRFRPATEQVVPLVIFAQKLMEPIPE